MLKRRLLTFLIDKVNEYNSNDTRENKLNNIIVLSNSEDMIKHSDQYKF